MNEEQDKNKREENQKDESLYQASPPSMPFDDLDGPPTEEEDQKMLDEVDREILGQQERPVEKSSLTPVFTRKLPRRQPGESKREWAKRAVASLRGTPSTPPNDDPNRPETEEDGIRAQAVRRGQVRHNYQNVIRRSQERQEEERQPEQTKFEDQDEQQTET